jgi:hypothetical protein
MLTYLYLLGIFYYTQIKLFLKSCEGVLSI